jgi:sulfur relay (sulfurtransferase) complex TusBCD TusD component (DsrE family)
MARGYSPDDTIDYPESIKITSLHDFQKMIAESDRVISITR